MRDYKKIKAFQCADDLVVEIYSITKDFPKEELYGLTSQLRRAVVSVVANIAEGASRQHRRDYLNFLFIARGSLAETEYLLHLTCRLGYLTQSKFEKLEALKNLTFKTLFGLISAVEKELKMESQS
jgi:four helix bundle protein